jgi:dimethylargininase
MPVTRPQEVARMRLDRPVALVRPPGPRLAEGIVTHIGRTPIDVGLAQRQWVSYVAALRANGWDIAEVPGNARCPDAVFVEDAVVVFGDRAIITRPGAFARREETDVMDDVLDDLGLPFDRITEPGTLDGGDVLKVGRTVYVGRGGRTNADGVRQLRRLLEPDGWAVTAVPLSKVLHLKSAVTALPDGSIIGYPPLVDRPGFFPRFVPVPEESGSHVVCLGAGRLLMADDCPRTHALLEDLGYDVVVVDISEYERLEGCVTCLSVRIRPEVPPGGRLTSAA